MIFIVEGPDGSGKSTLANELSERFSLPVVHRSKPANEQERVEMLDMYKDLITSTDIILDRSWYSEMVYGKVMRDEACISATQMYELETILMSAPAMLIYCTDETYKMWERCRSRGEHYITNFDTMKRIHDEYNKVMFDMPHCIPVLQYTIPGDA